MLLIPLPLTVRQRRAPVSEVHRRLLLHPSQVPVRRYSQATHFAAAAAVGMADTLEQRQTQLKVLSHSVLSPKLQLEGASQAGVSVGVGCGGST